VSWEQLLDIARANAAERQRDRTKPPDDCPRDGTALQAVDGDRHCQFCGWLQSRDWR
jgi:hypothetical protein